MTLKNKISEGNTVYGTFAKGNDCGFAEIAGYAGLDFIIFDAEHGTYSWNDLSQLVRAADYAGVSGFVRVPSAAEENIEHALDLGAEGVIVPSLKSAEEAEKAVMAAKYAPEGHRGLSLDQRSAKHSFADPKTYFQDANKNTMIVLQAETAEFVDDIENVVQIPNIDMIFIGPGDLSASYGKPGQLNCDEVTAAIQKTVSACQEHDIPVGIFAGNLSLAKQYEEAGIRMIAYSTDYTIYGNALKNIVRALKEN